MSGNFLLVYSNVRSVDAIRNALLLGVEKGFIKGFKEKKLEDSSTEWKALNAKLAYLESPENPNGSPPVKMRHQIPMMRYIGRIAGLYPRTEPERALLIDEVLEMCHSFRLRFGNLTDTAEADKLVCETFQFLEQLIAQNVKQSGNPWICGLTMTIADLEVASLIGWLGLPKFIERGVFDRDLFSEEFKNVRNVRRQINEHNFFIESNARHAMHYQLCKSGAEKPGEAHTSVNIKAWRTKEHKAKPASRT
eukprot:GEMP01047625.1.p1 GENE.GEMP01047625.1~~GEMP01047625.1.p1  ORF type:complete len:250 (+),score=56.95 GEMP01047625.1:173-922(+)